jgi:NAD(P)-dependent dehydrogenase (short-subunit alcohol dehydrogenase family)
LITGASRGLGRAFAQAALDAGQRVALVVREPAAVADLVRAHPSAALALGADVADRAAVVRAVGEAQARFGRIDVLVNNAGYALTGGIEELSEADARRQLDVNVLGALWCTQQVLPLMRAQGSGHIVQISSTAGIRGRAGIGMYCASKFALEGLSEALADEVAGFGIAVTIVEPGPFRTGFLGSVTAAQPLPAYDGVLAATREGAHGAERGDPQRAAEALLRVVASPHPPRRLALGAAAADLAREVYARRLSETEGDWARIGRDTDHRAGDPV